MSKLQTPEGRSSYPSVFETRHNKMKKRDEYSIQLLFAPGEKLTELKKAAHKALQEKFGANYRDNAALMKVLKLPFRDQADREKTDEKTGKTSMPDGYVKGALYLNLASKSKPGVVGPKADETGKLPFITDEADFYAGCYARAIVSVYAYSHSSGTKGVNFGLQSIQKTREGGPFGNRSKPQDDFEPIVDENEGTEETGSVTDLL